MTDTLTKTPPGLLREVVTHLEMLSRPDRPLRRDPPAAWAQAGLVSVPKPALAYYRFLYDTVGEPWLWRDRRVMSDTDLTAAIHAPGVEVHVLMLDGQPGGYVELDRGDPANVELVFCGLMPWAIGGGLGPWMLDQAIAMTWDDARTRRLWVHTCSFDHPRALAMYEKAGFVRFGTEENLVPDPRLTGILPLHAAPHVPLAETVA